MRDHRLLDPSIGADACGGALLGASEDQPIALVQVELRLRLEERHVRVEVCGEGPHVLPVAAEAVRHHLCTTSDHGGEHVGAKVGTFSIEPRGQRIGSEGVDPHAGEATGWPLRLLLEARDTAPLIGINDSHTARIVQAHLTNRDGHVGTTALMGGNQALVIHLVDVIAGEHEHGLGSARDDLAKVLQHRIRRAAVPVGRIAATDLRLQESHATDRAVKIPRPSAPNMVIQRSGVVLREHQHVLNSAIHTV